MMNTAPAISRTVGIVTADCRGGIVVQKNNFFSIGQRVLDGRMFCADELNLYFDGDQSLRFSVAIGLLNTAAQEAVVLID